MLYVWFLLLPLFIYWRCGRILQRLERFLGSDEIPAVYALVVTAIAIWGILCGSPSCACSPRCGACQGAT